jgi:hypothetical protein
VFKKIGRMMMALLLLIVTSAVRSSQHFALTDGECSQTGFFPQGGKTNIATGRTSGRVSGIRRAGKQISRPGGQAVECPEQPPQRAI